jgi:transposase
VRKEKASPQTTTELGHSPQVTANEYFAALSRENTALQEENKALREQNEVLRKNMEYLQAQVRLLTTKSFGASREKTPPGQLPLPELVFNEAEATAELSASEPDLVEVKIVKRKKRKGQRDELFQGLPERVIEHTFPDDELACPCCGSERHIMGEEELHIVPAQFWVDVHVQHVYACRHCQEHGDGSEPVVVTAPKPKRPIPGSIASPSAIAHVMEQKYVMGVPLYRQEQQWERLGINISRQAMSNWILQSADNWLGLIYDRMKNKLLQEGIIQADETTVQVLHEDGRKAESQSYMWLYRSGRYGPGIVLYEYQPSRSGDNPKAFLKGFKGFCKPMATVATTR